MSPNERLIEMASEIQELAVKLRSRIPTEGQILGWRGFHIDLDEIDDLTRRLRLGARGVFESSADTPSKPTESK